MGFTSFTITGGEPFIHPGIFDIIRSLNPSKVWIACATNGTLSTLPALKEAKKAGLDCVYVSIDSMDASRHDSFRGETSGTFDKAMSTIENALSIGLKVAVNTTITRNDLESDNFRDIISFARNRRLLVLLNLAAPAGKWIGHDELYFNHDDTRKLMEILRDNPHVRTDMEANYLEWGCPSFKERLYITSNGEVLPCPFIHISFGNIRDEALKDIIKKALDFPVFKYYQPLCLASQDMDFIRDYIKPFWDSEIKPVSYEKVFKKNSVCASKSVGKLFPENKI